MKRLFRRTTKPLDPSICLPRTGLRSWHNWLTILAFAGLLVVAFHVLRNNEPRTPPPRLPADLDCKPLATADPWTEAVARSLAEWIEDARTISGDRALDRERRSHALSRTDGKAAGLLGILDSLARPRSRETEVTEVRVLPCDSSSPIPAQWEIRWRETIKYRHSGPEITPWRAVLQVEGIPVDSPAHERYSGGFRITGSDWTSGLTTLAEIGVEASSNTTFEGDDTP